jgi:hypothetical protein
MCSWDLSPGYEGWGVKQNARRNKEQNKLRGLSPRAKHADRETAACR